jgi:hypothetical protein
MINRRTVMTAALAAIPGMIASRRAVAQTGMSRATAYAFSFPGLAGGDIRLAEFAGRPILIVNGASEETGRRILTSTVDLGSAVDADDFHRIVKRDVAISTAIHNGARFPWISPAGTLTAEDGAHGHILDGGYFDAAGVAALGELAEAIAALPERKQDKLHFIFVFIGYDGATEESRPPGQQPEPGYLPTGGTLAAAPPASTASAPDQQRSTTRQRDKAPLNGLFASRTAHGPTS